MSNLRGLCSTSTTSPASSCSPTSESECVENVDVVEDDNVTGMSIPRGFLPVGAVSRWRDGLLKGSLDAGKIRDTTPDHRINSTEARDSRRNSIEEKYHEIGRLSGYIEENDDLCSPTGKDDTVHTHGLNLKYSQHSQPDAKRSVSARYSQEELRELRSKINSRERRRMHDLNSAMDSLRDVMPYAKGPSVRKLSKIATLTLARNYIQMLNKSVEEMKQLLEDVYRSGGNVGPGGGSAGGPLSLSHHPYYLSHAGKVQQQQQHSSFLTTHPGHPHPHSHLTLPGSPSSTQIQAVSLAAAAAAAAAGFPQTHLSSLQLHHPHPQHSHSYLPPPPPPPLLSSSDHGTTTPHQSHLYIHPPAAAPLQQSLAYSSSRGSEPVSSPSLLQAVSSVQSTRSFNITRPARDTTYPRHQ
ncbi:hypothetical protein RRG08_021171 [Elysia crispata]|uniref:BHLH domain-containing protein n=1 Tax=Elysia crispata TaxID=231223 RepID=A0AAE1DAI0_9GAST|nr:hypothetical protein RRG08_021171 [Elysia crispata]